MKTFSQQCMQIPTQQTTKEYILTTVNLDHIQTECLPCLPDLYYGGEPFSVEQPQAFTCPYCGRMGHTEISLQEHVAAEHTETSTEVVR